METNVTISFRKINRKNIIEPQIITLAVQDKKLSIGGLLSAVVGYYVDIYNAKGENQALTLLTSQSIKEQSETGKVFNELTPRKPLEKEKVIADTIQGFKDKLFLLFIDDVSISELDEEVEFSDKISITFIKLIMLSGGIW